MSEMHRDCRSIRARTDRRVPFAVSSCTVLNPAAIP
jgi:hypothetical protein